MPFGGMFRRTHTTATREEENTNVEVNQKREVQATEEPKKRLTQEALSQKWFEFALQLPVNERALGDRMKIISPEQRGDNLFVIKVDNKMVAELFATEAKRITTYISEQLSCGRVDMKIELNEQQIQRRIYNRTEQFKLLAEKNPALEKLREHLNLDFS
jgi:DNA polymerase-3 subunit gamma/tau